MQSGEIIEDKIWELQTCPSPYSNSFSFPFYVCKIGNGNRMLLFGYFNSNASFTLVYFTEKSNNVQKKFIYQPQICTHKCYADFNLYVLQAY